MPEQVLARPITRTTPSDVAVQSAGAQPLKTTDCSGSGGSRSGEARTPRPIATEHVGGTTAASAAAAATAARGLTLIAAFQCCNLTARAAGTVGTAMRRVRPMPTSSAAAVVVVRPMLLLLLLLRPAA